MKHLFTFLWLAFLVSSFTYAQAQKAAPILSGGSSRFAPEMMRLISLSKEQNSTLNHQARSVSASARTAAWSDEIVCDTLLFSSSLKPEVCAGAGPLYPNVFTAVSIAIPLCYSNPTTLVVELSGPSGNFDNPTVLASRGVFEAYDLFTAAKLPNNLAYGTGYRIRIHETNANIYSPATDPFTINPLPQPAIIGLASSFCQDGPVVSLNGNGSGGSFTIDGMPATLFKPYSLSVGQHTVTYSLTNTSGCVGTTSQIVTVNEVPAAPSLLTATGQPYPGGVSSLTVSQNTGNVLLSVSGCQGGSLTWSGGSATTLAVSTSNLGPQSFTATCTNATTGCTSPVATATVTVVAPTLEVLSRDPDNGQLNNNTIKPYLLLQNIGTTPIAYSSITLRYWLTTEDNVGLIFQKNYVSIGQNNLMVRYVPLATPRQGATGYIEYSFSTGAGSLAPMGQSGPLEIQVNKQDYSRFNQFDDYSYINNSAFTLNARITAYINGVIFYGTEPSGTGSSRQGIVAPEAGLHVRVLGNPVVGSSAQVEIRGAEGQPVQLQVVNLQGQSVHSQRLEQAGPVESVSLPLGSARGVVLLQVNSPNQRQQVKLLRP